MKVLTWVLFVLFNDIAIWNNELITSEFKSLNDDDVCFISFVCDFVTPTKIMFDLASLPVVIILSHKEAIHIVITYNYAPIKNLMLVLGSYYLWSQICFWSTLK